MKPRLFTLFLLAVICSLALPGAALAQDGPSASERYGPAYDASSYRNIRPPDPLRIPDGDTAERLPRSIGTTSLSGEESVVVGQPGTSFRYVQTFGEPTKAYLDDVTHINYPFGLTTDSANVWIADSHGLRALKYRNDGAFVSQIGVAGFRYGTGESLEFVADVGVDGAGNVWLVDSDAGHVLKFDSAGKYVGKLGRSYDSGQSNDRFSGPHGIAFDGAGNIYVSDSWNNRIQVFRSDLSHLATIGVTGVDGSDNAHFCDPQHIAIAGTSLWVADACNHRVQEFNITNPAAAVYQRTIGVSGQAGSDNAHLDHPSGVAVDANRICVADENNHRVQVFNRSTGAYEATISDGWGQDNNHLRHPSDVAVDASGNLYVSDWLNARVQQFNSSLAYIRTYGVTSTPYLTDDAHYNKPSGVAVAPDGSIYLTEGRGQRLIKLDVNGAPQWSIGAAGVVVDADAYDRLSYPNDVAIAPSGLVYVAESGNNRIQVFKPDGSYYATLGGEGGTGNYQFHAPFGLYVARDGMIYVADYDNHRVQIYNSNRVYVATLGVTGIAGSDNAHFSNPNDVVVDGRGFIYVSENSNYRVQVFDANRQYVRTIGVTGEGGDDFNHLSGPSHLAVDAQNNLYVSSAWNHKVQVYDQNGAYLTSIGPSRGTQTGQLADPHGLAVDNAGNLYIADYNNHRIQKFALGTPGWKQVNINGFGDRYSGWLAALAPFGGNLYAGTGSQLWRMSAAGAWTLARGDGFGDTNNWIDDLYEFGGQLYVGLGHNVCDDPDCNTWHSNGGQIWRSSDGANWSQVVSGGLGDTGNTEVQVFAAFGGQLYAATWSNAEGHGTEIWRSASGAAGSWSRVVSGGFGDPNNFAVLAFTERNGYLYAGTYNSVTGGEVWRSANGTDWVQVNTDGFDAALNFNVSALGSFDGGLYAGTFNSTTGGQIWRCAICDGSDWTRIVADGFGSAQNRVSGLLPFNGALYAIATNYVGEGLVIRRTNDGVNWTPAAPMGFGDSNNRAYWENAFTVYNNRLCIGATNYANGAEVWVTALTADFTATPSRGRPPLTVQFTNTTVGDYTTSLWDFGDGATSAEKNPMHTYAQAGTYTVRLTVGDGTDSDTVTRPAAVRVGYTIYLPLVTRNWDPLMYDNFDDPTWDGAWNPAKWSSEQTATVYRQQGGALIVTEPPSANPTGGSFHIINPKYRSWQKTQRVEARLKVSSDRTGGWSPIGIAAVVENLNGHTWFASCRVGASVDMSQASFGCSVFVRQGDDYPSEYETTGVAVDYNTWHTARIETDASTGNVRFYLNNMLIGSHTPVDAAALVTSNQVELMITNWGVDPNSSATRYVDDVRITPAK